MKKETESYGEKNPQANGLGKPNGLDAVVDSAAHENQFLVIGLGSGIERLKNHGWANYRHEISEAFFFRYLASSGFARIVDYGCSLGHFSNRIASYNRDAEVIGVEYQPEIVELAARNYPGITFIAGALPEVGFEDVDAIFLLEVLYILDKENQEKALQNLKGSLKPGGVLFFSADLKQYTPSAALALLDRHFDVADVGYVYTKIGSWAFRTLERVSFLTDFTSGRIEIDGEGERIRDRVRRLFAGCGRIPVVGVLFTRLFCTIHRSVKKVSRSTKLFRSLVNLGQMFTPKSQAGYILIVATKPVE